MIHFLASKSSINNSQKYYYWKMCNTLWIGFPANENFRSYLAKKNSQKNSARTISFVAATINYANKFVEFSALCKTFRTCFFAKQIQAKFGEKSETSLFPRANEMRNSRRKNNFRETIFPCLRETLIVKWNSTYLVNKENLLKELTKKIFSTVFQKN